jgi:hypothetical protein
MFVTLCNHYCGFSWEPLCVFSLSSLPSLPSLPPPHHPLSSFPFFLLNFFSPISSCLGLPHYTALQSSAELPLARTWGKKLTWSAVNVCLCQVTVTPRASCFGGCCSGARLPACKGAAWGLGCLSSAWDHTFATVNVSGVFWGPWTLATHTLYWPGFQHLPCPNRLLGSECSFPLRIVSFACLLLFLTCLNWCEKKPSGNSI